MINIYPIGIMQGRLVLPKGRGIQFFPFAELRSSHASAKASAFDEWRQEFKVASEIKLDEIDFIFDLDRYQENPLWTKEGIANVQEAIAGSGVKVKIFAQTSL